MTHRIAALAPIALCVALTASCGFPEQGQSEAIDVNINTIPDAEPTVPVVDPQETVRVWMVSDTTLISAERTLPLPTQPTDVLAALAAGVTADESAKGLRSAIPDSSMVIDATVAGGTAIVVLRGSFLDIPADDQVFAVGQIVFTLTDLRGVGRVRFEIDGEPVAVPLPNGDSSQDAVSRDDFSDLLRD
ncbi:MAG TPA: GerMN domain-containing protein [Ilumatobacteraceae bacterium]|nr:GerMN domain-containing protein [Ilumatobacteraceae bacterium]